MFVADGAQNQLLAHEREAFLKNEWPRIVKQIKALGLDIEDLMRHETE